METLNYYTLNRHFFSRAEEVVVRVNGGPAVIMNENACIKAFSKPICNFRQYIPYVPWSAYVGTQNMKVHGTPEYVHSSGTCEESKHKNQESTDCILYEY